MLNKCFVVLSTLAHWHVNCWYQFPVCITPFFIVKHASLASVDTVWKPGRTISSLLDQVILIHTRVASADTYLLFQIFDTDGSQLGGAYCGYNHPTTIRSTGNRLQIKFRSGTGTNGVGFVAYYEITEAIPVPGGILMAASLTGSLNNRNAMAFLLSPLVEVSETGSCLTFKYSLRSNLIVKRTNQAATDTMVVWGVDGGRAFHRAALDLPQGLYKLIWETTDLRTYLGKSSSAFERYRVSIAEINIYRINCTEISEFRLFIDIIRHHVN